MKSAPPDTKPQASHFELTLGLGYQKHMHSLQEKTNKQKTIPNTSCISHTQLETNIIPTPHTRALQPRHTWMLGDSVVQQDLHVIIIAAP